MYWTALELLKCVDAFCTGTAECQALYNIQSVCCFTVYFYSFWKQVTVSFSTVMHLTPGLHPALQISVWQLTSLTEVSSHLFSVSPDMSEYYRHTEQLNYFWSWQHIIIILLQSKVWAVACSGLIYNLSIFSSVVPYLFYHTFYSSQPV